MPYTNSKHENSSMILTFLSKKALNQSIRDTAMVAMQCMYTPNVYTD